MKRKKRKNREESKDEIISKRRSDLLIKLVLCGDGAVGKTSLRERFLGRGFSSSYLQTIGADFAKTTKEIVIENTKRNVQYQIWDLAGQTEFGKVRTVYYQGCLGALMVFDITRPVSFQNLTNWVDELWKNSGRGKIPIVLLGNKADLKEKFPEYVQEDAINQYLDNLNAQTAEGNFSCNYLETSALTGKNVDEAFNTLGINVVKWIEFQRSKK
ncbi:MAG: Rab family GTPase [Candidatus Hodarchaeales archaeon]|jgi:small GTP-binding protein